MIGSDLSFSLGQQSMANLFFKNLQNNLSEAGVKNVTQEQVQKYSEMGADAWALLGAQAAQVSSSSMSTFCATQRPIIEMYQAQLQWLESEFTEAASDLISAATTWNLEGNLASFQKTMAEHAVSVINILNTFNEGRGYLFAGAQTDLKPINPQLAKDLCHPGGADMTLGDIDNYFLSGPYADAQLPLTLLYQNTVNLDLPVCANDFQSAFQTFLGVLSLVSETAAEGIRALQGGFDGALYTLKQALLDTSTLLSAFEDKTNAASAVQTASADQINLLLEANPTEAALNLYRSEEALKAFMQYTMNMLQFQQALRNITRPLTT